MIREDVPASYRDRVDIITRSSRSPDQDSTMAGDDGPQRIDTDDIFGDSSPPLGLSGEGRRSDLNNEASEIPSLRRLHETAGYREGVTASKAHHLQDGFDEGFALGAEIGLRAGWILGCFDGIIKALGSRVDAGASGRLQSKEDVVGSPQLAASARDELKLEMLFGSEWINEEGLWKWDVPEEGEVTFKEVAAAHPVLRKWEATLNKKSEDYQVQLSFPRNDEVDEA